MEMTQIMYSSILNRIVSSSDIKHRQNHQQRHNLRQLRKIQSAFVADSLLRCDGTDCSMLFHHCLVYITQQA